YVTLEPCPMCAGAICNARLKGIYFGAYEKKSGAVVSKYSLLNDNGLNHNCAFLGGIKEEECKMLLVNFFKKQRKAEITKK
ncbi:MAG TPA: tRNA-specific adenosine deaminase, partial [Clostridiales bacterium]|nr:tRNA-specific adenosine deaminase [Clostridiales bacterium]